MFTALFLPKIAFMENNFSAHKSTAEDCLHGQYFLRLQECKYYKNTRMSQASLPSSSSGFQVLIQTTADSSIYINNCFSSQIHWTQVHGTSFLHQHHRRLRCWSWCSSFRSSWGSFQKLKPPRGMNCILRRRDTRDLNRTPNYFHLYF